MCVLRFLHADIFSLAVIFKDIYTWYIIKVIWGNFSSLQNITRTALKYVSFNTNNLYVYHSVYRFNYIFTCIIHLHIQNIKHSLILNYHTKLHKYKATSSAVQLLNLSGPLHMKCELWGQLFSRERPLPSASISFRLGEMPPPSVQVICSLGKFLLYRMGNLLVGEMTLFSIGHCS